MRVPASVLTSSDVDLAYGRPTGWLHERCGVERRHVCADERQEILAAGAAMDSIAEAGLGPGDIDLVISSSSVSTQPIPGMAPLVAREIGIAKGRCAAFDVNATCLGFLTALDVASTFIAAGRYATALVVSSDLPSKALAWETDPTTAGLFGDGAAAAVLVRNSGPTTLVRAALSECHQDGYELCQIKSGGTAIDLKRDPERFAAGSVFEMDGHGLFRLTAQRFPAFLERLLAAAGWSREDVDLVVPHQASRLALRHLVDRCGFAADKVVDIVETFGNQVSASIPTALHIARTSGWAETGARVLMLGTSAGVSFGGLALVL